MLTISLLSPFLFHSPFISPFPLISISLVQASSQLLALLVLSSVLQL